MDRTVMKISSQMYYYYYYKKKRFRWRNVKRLQGHLTNAKDQWRRSTSNIGGGHPFPFPPLPLPSPFRSLPFPSLPLPSLPFPHPSPPPIHG